MVEEVSEERSGDQPAADDDATTAPVPERVSIGRDPVIIPRKSRLNLDSNNNAFTRKKPRPPDLPRSLSPIAGPGRGLPELSEQVVAQRLY